MVKPRRPADPAAIAAFGAAADEPSRVVGGVVHTPAPPTSSKEPAGDWPTGVPKALQLRFKNPEDALLLQQLTTKLDRSQHDTALRAFRRGLETMLAEE